jgi:hypothetical protein
MEVRYLRGLHEDCSASSTKLSWHRRRTRQLGWEEEERKQENKAK